MEEASISAALLVFTNIKLDFALFTAPVIALIWASNSVPGHKISISISLLVLAFTTVIVPVRPAKYLATSSGLPTVADRHMRWKSPESRAIRSSAIESCAPRFEFTSSCTSSIITCFTDFKFSRSLRPGNIACIVSGVVMSISGGFIACFLLIYALVSPWRTSILMPSSSPQRFNLNSISRFKARRGVI